MKRYYKVGLRPVYFEEIDSEPFVYVFDWKTGTFIDDFTYFKKIFSGPFADETEEISESEFQNYVIKLKKERGFS